jgi:outer membrane protein assembly factor BamE (lipoprotein component of BamABCDE complex)
MMMKIAVFLLALAFAGCASVGTPIAQENVKKIRPGVTTEADLVRMFGPPSTRTLDSNGKTILGWIYSEAQTKGTTFIPIAGPFVGGVNTRTQMLSVLIARNGKVERYTMNDTPTPVKQGVAAEHAE